MNTHIDDVLDNADPDDAQLRGLLGGTANRLRANVRMERALHQITEHGRRIRRRRRYAMSTAGAAAAAAIAVGAVVVPGGSGTASPAKSTGLNVDLADFSLKTGADGTVNITIKQLGDASLLQRYLRQSGVNAQVEEYQTPDLKVVPGCGLDSHMSAQEQAQTRRVVTDNISGRSQVAMILHPDAMPAGSTLDFAITQYVVNTSDPGMISIEFGVFDGLVPPCSPSQASVPATLTAKP